MILESDKATEKGSIPVLAMSLMPALIVDKGLKLSEGVETVDVSDVAVVETLVGEWFTSPIWMLILEKESKFQLEATNKLTTSVERKIALEDADETERL